MEAINKLAQLRVKKKKTDEELAQDVDVYEPTTWNQTVDDDAEEKEKFKRKYRGFYDRLKDKQEA
jgi:DNA-binding XRE family transcriptional regulator